MTDAEKIAELERKLEAWDFWRRQLVNKLRQGISKSFVDGLESGPDLAGLAPVPCCYCGEGDEDHEGCRRASRLAEYVQHKESCAYWKCATEKWVAANCTCGLSDLAGRGEAGGSHE